MNFYNLLNSKGTAIKNQYVIEYEQGYAFKSYDTYVAYYDVLEKKLIFSQKWCCSTTTLRHLYAFLRKYTPYVDIQGKKDIENLVKNGNAQIMKVDSLDLKNVQ